MVQKQIRYQTFMPFPRILITNDDSIHAPGIKHLWNALKEMADLTVVAPAHEQSAVSLSITIRQPLRIEKTEWSHDAKAWSVNGTPADCVKMALNVVFKEPPDLIVSGINCGSNSGRNVLYSGTVAAVIEGIMHNIPGIAFSCCENQNPDYRTAEKYVPAIVQHVLDYPMPAGTLLNVNFPCHAPNGIQGIKMAAQGKEYWMENFSERIHPTAGHSYYWLGAKLAEFEEDEESDVALLRKGYISAVPIRVQELTDHHYIRAHKALFEKLLAIK